MGVRRCIPGTLCAYGEGYANMFAVLIGNGSRGDAVVAAAAAAGGTGQAGEAFGFRADQSLSSLYQPPYEITKPESLHGIGPQFTTVERGLYP